jgi:hypothetical protein
MMCRKVADFLDKIMRENEQIETMSDLSRSDHGLEPVTEQTRGFLGFIHVSHAKNSDL